MAPRLKFDKRTKPTGPSASERERLIEQEEDRQDVEIAERRLADPSQIPIPYSEVRKRLGLADV